MIVLVGLPGSGKSTWARTQAMQTLSSDEIRKLLSGDETNQSIHGPVFATMRHLLRTRLQTDPAPTIVDATNLRRRDRRPWLQIAKQFGVTAEAVYFDVPLELALARNAKRDRVVPADVIQMLQERLQPPTQEEGFSAIRTISS